MQNTYSLDFVVIPVSAEKLLEKVKTPEGVTNSKDIIEYILLGIPMQLVVDFADEEDWKVLNPKTLNVVRRFLQDKATLRSLKYFPHLEGLKYSELPPHYQTKLKEYNFGCIMLKKGTSGDALWDVKSLIDGGLFL